MQVSSTVWSTPSRTVCLLTRHSWLKTGLPPTAVNLLAKVNGHQTRRTSLLLIIMSGELCLNITKYFYPKPKNTDGLKKVLQLIWNQLPQLDSINKAILSFTDRHWACVKDGMDIQNVLWEKLFNDVEHWKLQVTVHFFSVILNKIYSYWIKCNSCNSWSYENISMKFSKIVRNSFQCTCKSWNFV